MSLALRSTSPVASTVEPCSSSLLATSSLRLPPALMLEPVLVICKDSLSCLSIRSTSTVFLDEASADAWADAAALAPACTPTLLVWPLLLAETPAPACALDSPLAWAPAWLSVLAYRPRRVVVVLELLCSMFCAAKRFTLVACRSRLPPAFRAEPCSVTSFLALMVTLPPRLSSEPTLRCDSDDETVSTVLARVTPAEAV